MRRYFLEYYSVHNTDYTRPYDKVEELLSVLNSHGVKIAVASNKYQAGTQKLIQYFFPGIDFVSVLGQRDGIPVKPAPDIVYEILNKSGVEAEKALYVGDSDVDMFTAKAAGVESVGVTWGFRSREELIEAGACHLVDSPIEILRLSL